MVAAMNLSRLALYLALLLALAVPLAAQPPQWRLAPGDFAVTHVDVLSMTGPELLRDHTVTIAEGRITAVAPSAERAPDPGATVIDGRGLTLMPGLTDMHVHLNDTERDEHLWLYLAAGVTTVQSMHGTPRHLELRQRLAAGEAVGPRLFTTGPTTADEQVDSPEKAERVVTAQVDAGYDAIKMYGDGADTMTRDTYERVISAAHTRGVRVVGHAPRNLPFDVVLAAGQDSIDHMEEVQYTATPILDVMGPLVRFQFSRRGADEVQRLLARWDELSPRVNAAVREVAEQVKATSLALTPTLVAFETIRAHTTPAFDALLRSDRLRFMSPLTVRDWQPDRNRYVRAWADRREAMAAVLGCGLDVQKRLVRALHAAGVPILAGTDAPLKFVYPGTSLHRELELLVECGLTPFEALAAATVRPARALGIDDRVGTVSAGREADLVLVRGDPLADIRNAAQVVGVFARGRFFDRAALDAGVAGLVESYRPLAEQLAGVGPLLEGGDIDGALAAFRELQDQDELLARHVENAVNERGYALLGKGDVDGALAVFQSNCDAFPKAFNTWDSLGEAWMTKGDHERATALYRRSLELNPNNANATAMIARMQKHGR